METSLQRSHSRVGIGLFLGHNLEVLEVVSGGPCDGKVVIGDVITHVNDHDVAGKQAKDIIHHVLGPEKSSLMLCIQRGEQNIKGIEITRQIVNVEKLNAVIRRQIDLGFRKRDKTYIEAAFKRYAVVNVNGSVLSIPKENLLVALKEFDVAVKDLTEDDVKNVDLVFNSLDRNSDGILDCDEFLRAVQASSPLEEWARSLPLNQLLADAIPRLAGEDPLRAASRLNDKKIKLICGCFADGLERILTSHVAELNATFSAMDKKGGNPSAQKFESDIPKMRCGAIEDFHKGLSARTGNAHLDFENAMEIEHLHRPDNDKEFETTNYKIKTCPSREWKIVMGAMRCPEPQMMYKRRIPMIQDLLDLEVAKKANLIKAEVIAVVLYTGPMFFVYNAILRRYPDELYRVFNEANNFYPTTIFVLTSALQKLSRVTQIDAGMTLYRGLKGTVDLPELFFKCDEHGCTGFTEWGFMSTSSNMEVALEYSGVKEGGQLPRVLVITVGSVDRGACIKEFSQYQDELEYLYVPCSFVEKAGPSFVKIVESGVVEMIPVKVNSNIKAKTVDELVQQKKDMHVAAFGHHVEQIDRELHLMAKERDADGRLALDKSADSKTTMESFLARIVGQCKDVLSRHQAINHKDYVNDRVFRSLVMEMIEVKAMARTKLEEWLDNTSGSFIRFRWNAPLRTVHRRWTAYLGDKRLTAATEKDKKDAAVQLCKALGLFVDSVDEKNDLDETRLMSAAAEGRSEYMLRMLVEAGGSVNKSRPDGVTPVWLAAENGHVISVRALASLKANVRQAANDGTTPVSIAARNGKTECIKVLAGLGANVSQPDRRGSCPLHQAALYGYCEAITALVDLGADINKRDRSGFSPWDVARDSGHEACSNFIKETFPEFKEAPRGAANGSQGGSDGSHSPSKTLIITTGDISDVDGFFALAEYAKTGADVVFVLNYPAYIGVNDADEDLEYADKNPGLGYKYGAKAVFGNWKSHAPESYTQLLAHYETTDDNERMKSAMTDLAFVMANSVWEEVDGHGSLYFCIGGINAINPFSATAIKNEVLVYSEIFSNPQYKLDTLQGTIYQHDGSTCEDVQWTAYSDVYIDFNGSLAYWNGQLTHRLSCSEIADKIRGVFVMGGVYADVSPVTMPSIPDTLNRFSSATMNQLYHPQNAANFFAFLQQFCIPVYTVTNNVVKDLASFADAEKKEKTFDGVAKFLSSNELEGKRLRQLAEAHYNSVFNPPRKPYDFFTAFCLTQHLKYYPADRSHVAGARNSIFTMERQRSHSCLLKSKEKTLFYSNVYGITFVSESNSWDMTRASYSAVVDTQILPDDTAFVKTKKEYFKKEIEIMKSIDYLASLLVHDLDPQMDAITKRLSLPL